MEYYKTKKFSRPGKENKKGKIKEALVLPSTVLQLLAKGETPSKETVRKALDSIEEIVKLLKTI